MKQLNSGDAQANFEQVLDDVLLSGAPVKIIRDTDSAILGSKEVWRGMTETLSLLSIPSVRESVRFGMRERIADTTTGLDC